MIKKLKQFIQDIAREREVMLDWTFNRFRWKPEVKRIVPSTMKRTEITVQPMVSWEYGAKYLFKPIVYDNPVI